MCSISHWDMPALPRPLLPWLRTLALLPVLWLPMAPPAAAQTQAQDWATLAAELLQRPEFEALPLELRLESAGSTGGSPIEVALQPGLCVLHLRTQGHPATARLLALAAPDDRTLWMQAILVHEIAHCWRAQEDPPAMERLAALAALAGTPEARTQAIRQARHQRQREEAFADVAALAWVQRVAPARFARLLDGFQRLRGDLRLSGGPHDTRLALERLRRDGLAPGLAPFPAASALLQMAQD